jgi:hypothetical protein
MNDPTPLNSASQISTWDAGSGGCQRQWGFRYLVGVSTPSTPAQMLGDEVDTGQLQPYLSKGRPFDYTLGGGDSAAIATTALEYLPRPQTGGLEVQKHFTIPAMTARRADGSALFGYQGYLDLWHPEDGFSSIPGIPIPAPDGTPVVIDFKTTSDLKWAKTPEQLRKDPQAMLYATWAMFSTGARSVDLQWIYMQTKGARRSKRSYLRVYGDDVAAFFPRLDRTAVEMFDARTASGGKTGEEAVDYVLSLEPNPSACESFGGCPNRHRCNLSPSQIFDSQIAKYQPGAPDMSTAAMLAALKKKKAEATASTGGVTVAINPPESTLPPAAATGSVPAPPPPPVETPAPPPVETPAPAAAAPTEAPKKGPGRPPKAPPVAAPTIDIEALATLVVEKLADTLARGLTK